MAQFRTTADIVDLALRKAGEVTNGNSPYETQVLDYLNRMHMTLLAGGTIPIGKDASVTIDETWPWARSKIPLVLHLQPKINTGTVTFTQGSVGGTFSSAPAVSLEGWFIRVSGRATVYKIAHHAAAATAFSVEGEYLEATGSSLNFEAYKLDYELIPDYITVNSENDRIQFQEAAGTTLTGTLTHGVRTPTAHIAHVITILNATGGTPVYTGSYDSSTRKFTISSDRGGSSVFVLVGTGDQSHRSQHKVLGFDDENTTNAASIVSTYALGGIARLIEPMRVLSGEHIFGTDAESFSRDFPLSQICEGTPDRFAVIREDTDGRMIVRMNGFPKDETRVEVERVEVPRDLKDNSTSVPLIPRKHVDILEDAAVFYIMLDKNDDRASMYAQLLQGKLNAMISQHRGSLLRSGEHFGQFIPRRDLLSRPRNRLRYGYEDI